MPNERLARFIMLKEFAYGRYRHRAGRSAAATNGKPPLHTGKMILPTLAAFLFAAIFCALGFWQLDRADERRALQAEYDQRALQAPVRIDAALQPVGTLQFFRVQAQGSYENEYQLLLDNRVQNGAPGFHVITPLRLAGGATRVLVNRGWVPLGTDRNNPPTVTPPAEPVTVSGIAVVPRVGFSLGQPDRLRRDSPTVWQQLDLARYAAEAGVPLQPVMILLDPQSPAGGYVRDWARLDAGIAVHQVYAFQWFMLVLTVVGIYVVLTVRAVRRRNSRGAP